MMRKGMLLSLFMLASVCIHAQTLYRGYSEESHGISQLNFQLSSQLNSQRNFQLNSNWSISSDPLLDGTSTAILLSDAQNKQFSMAMSKSKSPKIAGLCSILPGGGQIYNGHYWKVPVVYAVLGASGGLTYYYHQKYIYYRTEYRLRLNGETSGLNSDLSSMSNENVYAFESYYRRNQELSLFVFLLCYGLNIVEAIVDAHFSTFNISDDLTLQLQPGLQIGGNGAGYENFAWGLDFVFHLK